MPNEFGDAIIGEEEVNPFGDKIIKRAPVARPKRQVLAPASPVIPPDAINRYRMRFFNTDNPNANIPNQLAYSLAKRPNDALNLSRLRAMSPVGQAAIRQRAAELAQENQAGADIEYAGPGLMPGAPPLTRGIKSKAPTVGRGLDELLGRTIEGPIGYERLQTATGAKANLKRAAYGSLSTQNIALAPLLGGLGMAVPRLTMPILGGIGAQMGWEAGKKFKQGDIGGGLVDVGMGLAPGALHGIFTSPKMKMLMERAAAKGEANALRQRTAAEVLQRQQEEVGGAGSERGGVEPSQQGLEAPPAVQPENQPEVPGAVSPTPEAAPEVPQPAPVEVPPSIDSSIIKDITNADDLRPGDTADIYAGYGGGIIGRYEVLEVRPDSIWVMTEDGPKNFPKTAGTTAGFRSGYRIEGAPPRNEVTTVTAYKHEFPEGTIGNRNEAFDRPFQPGDKVYPTTGNYDTGRMWVITAVDDVGFTMKSTGKGRPSVRYNQWGDIALRPAEKPSLGTPQAYIDATRKLVDAGFLRSEIDRMSQFDIQQNLHRVEQGWRYVFGRWEKTPKPEAAIPAEAPGEGVVPEATAVPEEVPAGEGATGAAVPEVPPTTPQPSEANPAVPEVAPEQPYTGPRNAITEAEAERWGIPQSDKQAYTDINDAWELGKEAIDNGTIEPRRLARRVADDPKSHQLSAEDIGALTYDRVDLIKEYETVLEAAKANPDDPQLLQRIEDIEGDLEVNTAALQRGGREQSAAFNARKLIVKRDYSVGEQRILVKAAAKDAGKTVSEAELAKGDKLSQTRKALQERIAQMESELEATNKKRSEQEAELALQKAAKDAEAEQARQAKGKSLQEEYDDVVKEIRNRLAKLTTGVPVDVLPAVTKLIRIKVKQGINNLPDLINSMYADLEPMLPGLTEEEVRDAIGRYGYPRKPVRSRPETLMIRELRMQAKLLSEIEATQAGTRPPTVSKLPKPASGVVKALRAQLTEVLKEKEVGRYDPKKKIEAYRKRLNTQIDDLNDRIARQDFAPKPPRRRLPQDDQVDLLKAERDRLQAVMDHEIEKRRPKSGWEKAVALHREFILSGPSVVFKLLGATAWGYPTETAADIVGGIYRMSPEFRRLADISGREGAAFSDIAAGAVRGLKTLGTKEPYQNVGRTITTGVNPITTRAGVQPKTLELGGAVGRLHGAEKAILQTMEYRRSVEIRTRVAERQGRDLNSGLVQAEIKTEAALDAWSQILQADNKLATMLQGIKAQASHFSKPVGYVTKTLIPITRVSSNYAGRTLELTGAGIFRALYLHAKALNLEKQGIRIEPHDARAIIRAYKYGGLGLVAAYLGWMNPEFVQSGGWYARGAKRQGREGLKEDELMVGGVKVPKILSHAPFLNAIQFWATLRNGFERTGISGALSSTVSGIAQQTPGIEAAAGLGPILQGEEDSAGKALGYYVRSLYNPQFTLQTSRYLDSYKPSINPLTWEINPRRVRGFLDTQKEGLPWMRNRLEWKRE